MAGLEAKVFIAGACAPHSKAQMRESAIMVASVTRAIFADKLVSVFIRTVATKEPTLPIKWTGAGVATWLHGLEVCQETGTSPATEITSIEEAENFGLLCKLFGTKIALIWFGSRLFKGRQIQESTEIVMKSVPELLVAIKNPPNENPRDWDGRTRWALESGIDPNRVFIINRGFDPQQRENHQRLRNIPNHDMTFSLAQNLKVRTILDASHSGGSPCLVQLILKGPKSQKYDGWMLETSPTPTKTDEKQRLTLSKFISATRIVARYI